MAACFCNGVGWDTVLVLDHDHGISGLCQLMTLPLKMLQVGNGT